MILLSTLEKPQRSPRAPRNEESPEAESTNFYDLNPELSSKYIHSNRTTEMPVQLNV